MILIPMITLAGIMTWTMIIRIMVTIRTTIIESMVTYADVKLSCRRLQSWSFVGNSLNSIPLRPKP